MKPQIDLMVDSGAYSAWTQGKNINLDEYCNFVVTNKDHIKDVINLDVIDPQGPDIAAEKGMYNFTKMKDKGIEAVPVFHAREAIHWLDSMLNMCSYIGLSGTSLVSPKENKIWHDLIWQYVTDKNGLPIARFHAFGDTSERSLTTYPFYSADSATWMIQAGRAARVKLQGKAYQLRSHSISDTNYISKDDTGPKRESWEYEIRSLGLDPHAVMTVEAKGAQMAMIRSYLVAADLLRLQAKSVIACPYAKGTSLISLKRQLDGGVFRDGPVHLHFVISPSAYYFNFPLIATFGITKILVSYYYLVTSSKGFWEDKLVPFLYNPMEFVQKDEKCKRFWDKLHECVLKESLLSTS